MKTMKRIITGLLIAGMMLAIVGCGGEEKTVTLRADMTEELGGIPATDTMTLTAKGDIIQQMEEIMEVDLSDIDDVSKNMFVDVLDSIFITPAQGIDGVTCSAKTVGTVYTIELIVDCTNSDTINAAAKAGVIIIDDDEIVDKLSLKKTQSSLIASGYKVVE